jgi:hypothetical protein
MVADGKMVFNTSTEKEREKKTEKAELVKTFVSVSGAQGTRTAARWQHRFGRLTGFWDQLLKPVSNVSFQTGF